MTRAAIRKRRLNRSRLPARPNYYLERQCWSAGFSRVAGVDEAGRGAWAGPLVAAAVVLPQDPSLRRELSRKLARTGVQVNDSKKLDAPGREAIVDALIDAGVCVAVASASSAEIDAAGVGYTNAALLRDAVLHLRPRADYALSDAFTLPDFGVHQRAFVAGDQRSRTIALASCVAKVARDRMMMEWDRVYPEYGFARHKGYGTPQHRAALQRLGICPIHRKSFAPIKSLVDG